MISASTPTPGMTYIHDDTVMQVGGEAFAARTIYAVSKTPFEAALRTAAEDLGKRFGRKTRTAPGRRTTVVPSARTIAHQPRMKRWHLRAMKQCSTLLHGSFFISIEP